MKQPKVITTPPPAPAPAILRGPRYRYFSTTPATVTLRMRDLQVPEKARTPGYNSEQFIDLPCSEIFHGPAPKIPLSRLAKLAPECVTAGNLPDQDVKLCSARLALAYVVTESRELLEEAPAPEPVPPEPVADETLPPTGEEREMPEPILEKKPVKAPPAVELEEIPPPAAKKADSAKLESAAPKVLPPDAVKTAPANTPADVPPAEAKSAPPAPVSSLPKIEPKPAPSAIAPSTATTTFPLPGAKKPFSLFPMFRRKEEADNKPSTPIPRSRIEIPKPKRPLGAPLPVEEDKPPADDNAAEEFAPKLLVPPPAPKPFEPAPGLKPAEPIPASEPPPPAARDIPPARPMQEIPSAAKIPAAPAEAPAPVEPAPPPAPVEKNPVAEDPVPAAPVEEKSAPSLPAGDPGPGPEATVAPEPAEPEALLVETEHVALAEVKPDISDQDALQAIFLTEEFLSVERVLELCGNLPGIKSCVLSQNAAVIAAHNTPDSVDIVSLSAHALEMLKAMRSASAKMGIGAVPAVTVHSEKGPITFFHQEDLCLLVLHKDRGFVPGVREKLQQVVTELAQAKLPLPVGKKLLGP